MLTPLGPRERCGPRLGPGLDRIDPSSQQQCDQLHTAPATRPPEGRTLQESVSDVRVRPGIQQDDAPMRQRQHTARSIRLLRRPRMQSEQHHPRWIAQGGPAEHRSIRPDWWALGEERSGSKSRCTSRAVSGASVRSRSTTHSRLFAKVDSTSGSEVAMGQGLAELLTREKNRCILVIAPAGVLAGHPSPAPDRGRDNFRDSCGDNRVRVSRDVVYT
jgi:hypothetical protein